MSRHSHETPASRRRALAASGDTRLIVVAGPEPGLRTGRDSALPGPEFYYLTGLAIPGARLLILPDGADLLFVPHTAPGTCWGEDVSEEQIREVSGIVQILSLTEYPAVLQARAFHTDRISVLAGENPFVRGSGDAAFIQELHRILPLHILDRVAPAMAGLRAVKSAGELAHLRQAGSLANAAMRRAIGFVRPGVRGFEVKAEILYGITRRGSAGWGCPPLTACGPETLLLHWPGDQTPWEAGAVALIDFTVEYGRQHVDVSRCVPVSGRFTARQRQIHEEVVGLLGECTALLRPGRTLLECQAAATRAIEAAAHRLGLSREAASAAWQHRIYHHIGLEVHDPMPDHLPLQPGAVIAVEPGIYAPSAGCGIRLENTVAITAEGTENLTKDIPLSAPEIEALMLG